MTINGSLAEKEYLYEASQQATTKKNILLIENDLFLSNSIKSYLSRQGFDVEQARQNQDIKQVILKAQPQMILLDIGFIASEQLSIIEDIRAIFSGLLIVLSSRRDSEVEQVQAFNLGADEYLVKPLSTNILSVRITSLFRRQESKSQLNDHDGIVMCDIELQPRSQKCLVNNQVVKLTGFEFNLLKLLMQNEGAILSRDAIYSRLLGRPYNGVERTVDVRMSQLREKLALEGMKQVQIETIWGQGYMLAKVN